MKRILLLLLIGLLTNLVSAQDIIVKLNGDEIKSKILEITSETIKYKEFEFQDGPIRNINISEVFMVIYENGQREKFTTLENLNLIEAKNEESSNNSYKGKYVMLGTGYGNSYGGAGIRFQWRTGGIQGFGIHAGAGYFPNAPILASVGVKFFPYKDLYINAQFGLTGWEEYYYIDYYYGYYDEQSHLLYGPSFLIGSDWTWGSKIGYGFNAGIGLTYNVNVEYFDNNDLTLALDLGFIIRF